MSVKTNGTPAPTGTPISQSDTQKGSKLEIAIGRSCDFLLSHQKPDGHWCFELMVDATLVADMVAYHHWNDKVDKEWQRKAVNHIFLVIDGKLDRYKRDFLASSRFLTQHNFLAYLSYNRSAVFCVKIHKVTTMQTKQTQADKNDKIESE